MGKENQTLSGLFYVLVSALLFSTGGLLIKFTSWSAISVNGMRSLVAGVVLYLILKKEGHVFVFNQKVLLGAVVASVMNYTFVIATKMTSAGNAIVLQFTQPIFIILFLWLFFGQKPNKRAFITCMVIFGGILCFFFDQLTFDSMLGNFFGIFSGATYAIVFLFKTMDGVDFECSMLYSFLLSAVVCIPSFMGEASYGMGNWACILLLGVFQMGLAFYCLGKGLSDVSPVTASLTSTIEPVLNPILVAMFYGETLGLFSILGAAVVLIASLVYNLSEQKAKNTVKLQK